MELHAALERGKPLIFACSKVVGGGATATRVKVERGSTAATMLRNCAHLVDVEAAQCAVPADKARELATIGPENFAELNRTVQAALISGAFVMSGLEATIEVDAFSCGEPGPLQALAAGQVTDVFMAACSAGQLAVLVELQRAHGEALAACLSSELVDIGGPAPIPSAFLALYAASQSGRCAVVEWLVGEMGVPAEVVMPNGGRPIVIAGEQGQLEVVRVLLNAGVDVNSASANGRTVLYGAALSGHVEVVRALLAAGANVDQGRLDGGWTPLMSGAEYGHVEIVEALMEAGAELERTAVDGMTALFWAAAKGHPEVVRVLLEGGANLHHRGPAGVSALSIARSIGENQDVVDLLASAEAAELVRAGCCHGHATLSHARNWSRAHHTHEHVPSTPPPYSL